MVLSGRSKGGKAEEVNLLEIFLASCQNDREVRRSKVLTLSIDIRVLGKSKDRSGMLPGRNTNVMISGVRRLRYLL